MSLYRKVELQTWGDAKFRALSPLPPCGQGLWLYLLTGPRTGILPGLIPAGRAAMAEELGWSLEAFDDAFDEAFREGMIQADWKARLVWLPRALRETNKPESLNVAIAWRKAFDRLPDCDLKASAGDAICLFLAGLGPKFLAAFTGDSAENSGVGKPSVKPSPKPSSKPTGKPSEKPSPKGSQKTRANQETGNRILKDPHTARAREASPPGRVVPFDAPPEEPRVCGYHSDNQAFNVPPVLHAQFVGRLVNAGRSVDAANEELFAWYPTIEAAWTGREVVVGDNDFKFWWARFGERYGTTVRPVEPPKVAGLAGGGVSAGAPRARWRCTHDWPHCLHRAACELVTARDVREGRLALADVQPALREAVRELVEIPAADEAREAVQA